MSIEEAIENKPPTFKASKFFDNSPATVKTIANNVFI
jgi:hypothetical protein